MKQLLILTALLFTLLMGCGPDDDDDADADDNEEVGMLTKEVTLQENDTTAAYPDDEAGTPHVEASDPIQAGRYLVIIGGCNDCHTDGFMMTEGNIAEENWLTGSPIGWQGPWGTTYPPNLRLRVQEWPEDMWVQTLKTRKALPPMPWMNINLMNEQDMKAIYAYIRSLGPKGQHMPLAVPPDSMPGTPYLSLFPQNLPTQ